MSEEQLIPYLKLSPELSETAERQRAFENTAEHRAIRAVRRTFPKKGDYWLELLFINALCKDEWEKLERIPDGNTVILCRAYPRLTEPKYATEKNSPELTPDVRRLVNHAMTRAASLKDIARHRAEGRQGWPLLLECRVETDAEGQQGFTRRRLVTSIPGIAAKLGVSEADAAMIMGVSRKRKPSSGKKA